MAKRAYCVGINDYAGDGSDLKGCVNDARTWADLLVAHYDFPRSDVRLALDTEATKSNMVAGLHHLLAGARPGDVLVFTNSSHGTYKAEQGGDEPTYDEALCPYDVSENLLLDDELRELFSAVPDGVHLVVISDSCHSGTVTRTLIAENIPGLRTPDHRRVRFYDPRLRGDPVLRNPFKAKPTRLEKYPEEGMRELLLSGCTNAEYSYDALLCDTYHGAMTYHALGAIRAADYRLTYDELYAQLQPALDEAGYPQHPQLEGRRESRQRQIFT